MQELTITISENKKMTYPSNIVLVEGENLTTQVTVSAPSWEGLSIGCLITTPAGVMVDEFSADAPFLLTNAMLDRRGYIRFEFVGYKITEDSKEEVTRTSHAVELPVRSARQRLGEISPEPLPDLISQVTNAKNTALTAAQQADAARDSAAEIDEQARAAEAVRVAREAERAAFYEGFEGELSALKTEPEFLQTAESESAALGEEILDGAGWTSDGWTGDFVTGFTHTSGNVNALSRSMPGTGTRIFEIEFDVSAPLISGELAVTIGNSAPFDLYIGEVTHIAVGIQSVSDGDLVFTPVSGFNKTLTNISAKEIVGIASASVSIKDTDTYSTIEIRGTKNGLYNAFIGNNSGRYNTKGHSNMAFGSGSMESNTTGFWNNAIGMQALRQNTVGSRNVAIGYAALQANISGQRNQAIGSFALCKNTTGSKNVAIGSDCMYVGSNGSYNVGIGFSALAKITTANKNVAIGTNALANNIVGDSSVAIGYNALLSATGSPNIAIGEYAAGKVTAGADNTIIGYFAGGSAGAVGSINRNTVLGTQAGRYLTTGADNNTLIGNRAGQNITTGKNNIIIGNTISAPLATTSNYLNIGGAITGDLTTKIINFENINLANVPTSDPHIAGRVWSSSGMLAISAG